MVAEFKQPRNEARTALALIQISTGAESEVHPPVVKKYSKSSVGRMLNPPVTLKTAAKYHRLAIAHISVYRKAFEYQWEEEVKVDESAEIPETHIPVIQRIRREYLRRGEHRPTDAYIEEWLRHPDTQSELTSLLDPMIALLYEVER